MLLIISLTILFLSGYSHAAIFPSLKKLLPKKNFVSIAIGFHLGTLAPEMDVTKKQQPLEFSGSISVANADSTGKMSTKMTARKRYLPRISAGVKELNEAIRTSKVDEYIANDLPGLGRAMNLYGASLRKGEYPDEVSRQSEKLTGINDSYILYLAYFRFLYLSRRFLGYWIENFEVEGG